MRSLLTTINIKINCLYILINN